MKAFTNIVASPACIIFKPTGASLLYVGYGYDVSILNQENEIVEIDSPNQATGLERAIKLGEKFYLTFLAGEMDLDKLKVFWGTSDVVDQTGSPPDSGTEEIEFGGNENPIEGLLYIYGMAPNGKKRKITFFKAYLTGDSKDYPLNRGETTKMPLKFGALIDDSKEPGHQMVKIEDDFSADYTILYGLESS